MTSSLLIRAIRQLPPKDRQAFTDFVQCPLFNRRTELVLLCRYLATNANRPGPETFSAEKLFEVAYPEQVYDNRKLRYLMSYTLDAYRQFLAMQEWQSDPNDTQRYLVSALRRRGLDKLFDKAVKKADAKMGKRPIRDARHHFLQYHIQQEKLEFKARHERSAKLNLQPLPDQLTAFYVSEMLRHGCSALMHQAVAGQTYQMELLDAVIGVVEKGSLMHSPAVAVYYHTYRMLQSPEDQEVFEQVKSLLVQHEMQFGQEEMRGLYLMVINGCIRRMNAGNKAFIREAFEVYRMALERGFLMENGFLSSFTYKNIIRIGAALGEHAWTEQFIEQQRSALHPRERENIYLYNRAFLYFERGNYAQAMPLLQQVELDDPLNSLHARRMLVRSYVELEEFSALESVLQSFGSLLHRQKNLGYHRDLNLNFVRFIQRLLKLPPGDQAAKKALQQDLLNEKQVAEKEWLLDKLR